MSTNREAQKNHSSSKKTKKKDAELNPYRPFDLDKGDWFYQKSVIIQIKETIEMGDSNHIITIEGNPGSGKSSTLRRIKNKPEMIGCEYLVLYVDSSKYKGFQSDELLFTIYRDIVVQLKQKGYPISIPAYYEKKKDLAEGLEVLLLRIEGVIEDNKKILIVFDDFDALIKNTEAKEINSVIDKFSKLIWNWERYFLILSGVKRFKDKVKSQDLQGFLSQSRNIDVEGYLDEQVLKELIEKPVMGKVHFTEDAIFEIIDLSGRNVYLQQLLCYYIFQDLTRANKEKCSKRDVEKSSKRLLADDRPAFNYAWNNLISLNGRIIASALADPSLTESCGESYDLKECRLLDGLFEGNISDEVEKIRAFGYITEMKGRRFKSCPFVSLLYGRWVRRKHPFLKTLLENINALAPRIDLKGMIEFLKSQDSRLISSLNLNLVTLTTLASSWLALNDHINLNHILKADNEGDEALTGNFFDSLSNHLMLKVQKEIYSNTKFFVFEIRKLDIGIIEEAFCFVQNKNKLTNQDISEIETISRVLAEDMQTTLTIFIYTKSSLRIEELVNKPYLNFIAIDENDIKRLILSSHPSIVFRQIVLSKLTLAKVSPYKVGGPAKTIFYGRKALIDRVSREIDCSYAVLGARRIGKSSLLMKIKEDSPPTAHYIYTDMESIFPSNNKQSYKPFLKTIQKLILEELDLPISFSTVLGGYSITRMKEELEKLEGTNIRLVFLIDEIDALIEFDRLKNYRLLKIMRDLSQKQICQFVFAGFKELYHRKRDINNPLYNFCEEILLEPLEKEAALDLITKPMNSIGVTYKNPDDRELILEYTANHPSLLQFFCKHLLEKVDSHQRVQERRTIYRTDIEELFDTKYESCIMEDVYMFNSDLNQLNRLLLILLVQDSAKRKIFSIRSIKSKLSKSGLNIPIEEVNRNVKNLVMRFILLDNGKDNYSFALPVFPDILKRWIGDEFDDYKNEIIQELKEND